MKKIVRLMMTGILFAGLAGGGMQAQAADFDKLSYEGYFADCRCGGVFTSRKSDDSFRV